LLPAQAEQSLLPFVVSGIQGMFESIRNHKKYLMGFLLILIVPGFVLFGVQGFSDPNPGGEAVASVDGKDITQAEWDQAHRVESQRLRDANPTLDAKLLDSDEFRYAALERLVRDRLLVTAAEKFKLYTSDQHLARALQQDPTIAALRRADGTLDVEAYKQLVGRQGMTPEMYEASVRADLSKQQVGQGVTGSGFVPADLAQLTLNAFFERREVRVQRFAAADQASRVQPADVDIERFYQENPALFQAPEQADVEYLVLDAAALQQSVTLNEADVRSYYEQNVSRLSGNEERRASHILLSVPAGAPATEKDALRQRAQALLEQVRKAPQTFAAVAKAESKDPGSAANGGDLDYFGRGAMVKPFEDAVFALEKGAISDVVETDFGFHIIQLTDIKAPKPRSFDEMRAQIETDLKQQQAQKLFAETADTFGNLVYEQADSLQPAAERLKLEVKTFKGLTRQPGADTGVLANPRMLDAIFAPEAVQSKRNTEAVETGSGQLAAARVVSHTPARTKPLAEVRDSVRARLVAQRAAELASEEGAKQLAAWKAGADASGMPASVIISREDPKGMPAALLKVALSTDPAQLPAWAGVSLGDQGYAVVKVEKILPRAKRDAAVPNQEVALYTQWWTAAESQAYYEMLKEQFRVKLMVPAQR
jgi:peptidyl-prolyl cis-trans isomerase D